MVTLDSISETRLETVVPVLADKIRDMAGILTLEQPSPILFRVTQGMRTYEEQAKLYAQGRSLPGKIVTEAKPGYSWHNFGMAIDVVPMGVSGPDWNTMHPVWQRLVKVGESLGMVAGAIWRSFPDFPHFQMTGRFPITPTDEVRELYKNVGVTGVWVESGLYVSPTQ